MVSWMGVRCIPKFILFFLQGCKSNRKFYKGENREWHILQRWKTLLTLCELCIVESLLASPCTHSHIESMVKNHFRKEWRWLWWITLFVRNDVGYGEEPNGRCLLCQHIRTVKLSLESYWYHMHVEVSKNIACTCKLVNVSYFVMWIGEYVHWCDLMNDVLMRNVDLYMLINMPWWRGDNIHVKIVF